jgi:DNA (cytosine-5)-methyltransferase 1
MDRLTLALQVIAPTETYPDLRSDYVACPSGLVLPEAHARARYAPLEPVCIDLFCGCGGASLGIMQAGFRIIAALDNDCDAAVTYMTNLCRYGEFGIHFVTAEDEQRLTGHIERGWKKAGKKGVAAIGVAGAGWISGEPPSVKGTANFIFGDIRKITGKRILDIIGMDVGEVDLITASPPCQGFSLAGKRDVNDPRNSLIWEWLRLVLEIQPKTICMENVPGIASMVTPDGVPVLDQIARVLEDGSFTTVDAFSRAIRQQARQAVGIMRCKPVVKPAKAARGADPDQIDLFDGGVA